jgi:tetratricopeptide (TPR) repeat protein
MEQFKEAIDLVENGAVEKGLKNLESKLENASHEEKYTAVQLYMQWGFQKEAKELIEELLFLYPDEGQLYITAAEIFIDMDDDEQALDMLNEIKEDDPSYVQALLLMADLYQVQGLDEAAERKLITAKKKMPNEQIIDFGLAEFYFSQGDYQKSIPYYEKIKGTSISGLDVNVALRLAEANSLSGKFEDALTYYEEGLKDSKDLHAIFGYGFTAFQLGQVKMAIKQWEELKELDPEYASVYSYLAKAYEQEGALKEAYDIAVEGIKKDEYNEELYLYGSKLALTLGSPAEAEKLLKQVLSIDPGYIEAVRTLTSIYLKQEKYDLVIDLIEHVKEYDEHDPQFEWDLATAKNKLEMYSEAIKHYANAYTSFKDNVQFLEDYGFFLLEEGRRDDAIQVFKRLLTIDPSVTNIEEEVLRLEQGF